MLPTFSEGLLLLFLGWAAIFDAKKHVLPLEPMWGALIAAFLWSLYQGRFLDALFGALFWFAWTGGIWYLSGGRWMGYADLWLTALTGAVLGVTHSLEAWHLTYVVIGSLVIILSFSGLIKIPISIHKSS